MAIVVGGRAICVGQSGRPSSRAGGYEGAAHEESGAWSRCEREYRLLRARLIQNADRSKRRPIRRNAKIAREDDGERRNEEPRRGCAIDAVVRGGKGHGIAWLPLRYSMATIGSDLKPARDVVGRNAGIVLPARSLTRPCSADRISQCSTAFVRSNTMLDVQGDKRDNLDEEFSSVHYWLPLCRVAIA